MTIQTFLATVESDIVGAFKTVEADAETALTAIWGVVKPAFISFEPTLVQGVLGAVTAFLGTASADLKGGTLADLETAFLNDLEAAGSTIFADAKTLGSDILQALMGLAKAA